MNGSQREVLCSWFSGIELASPSLPAGTSSPVPPHPPIGAFYALPSHTASCSFKRHTLATGRAVPTCHSPLSLLLACCLQGPSFPRWPFLCLQSWPWPERMHAEEREWTHQPSPGLLFLQNVQARSCWHGDLVRSPCPSAGERCVGMKIPTHIITATKGKPMEEPRNLNPAIPLWGTYSNKMASVC